MNNITFTAGKALITADWGLSALGSVARNPRNIHPIQNECLNQAFQPLAFADLIET